MEQSSILKNNYNIFVLQLLIDLNNKKITPEKMLGCYVLFISKNRPVIRFNTLKYNVKKIIDIAAGFTGIINKIEIDNEQRTLDIIFYNYNYNDIEKLINN